MPIKRAAAIVHAWATNESIIQRIAFFGSRVRGTSTASSDIDVAASLVFQDPNTCLAHWFANEDRWRVALQSLLPWKVDLQFLHPAVDGIVRSGVAESSLLVFERREA